MNKLPYILILLIALTSVILARFPAWSGHHPLRYETRSDARMTEYMATGDKSVLKASQLKGVQKHGGPVPLQRHRVLTAWLLRTMPLDDLRDRWAVLAALSFIVMAVSAYCIGTGLSNNNWKIGVTSAALAIATAGWQLGRLPWHKDVVVTALEFAAVALFIHRRYGWLTIVLCLGMLAKESFMFLTLGIGFAIFLEGAKEWLNRDTLLWL